MNNPSSLPPALESATSDFAARCDMVLREFTKTVDNPTTDLLYHYTSTSGLKGILSSGTLWLSDLFTQSDAKEWRWGMSKIKDILQKKHDQSRNFQAFVKHLNRIPWNKETKNVAHAFICCMAQGENPDGDPSQWNKYGDCGKGYALEFDGKMLSSCFMQAGSKHHHTFRMSYGTQYLNTISESLIQHLPALIEEAQKHDIAFIKHISELWYVNALMTTLLFKRKKYRSEREYRLMSMFPAGDLPPGVVSTSISGKKIVKFDWKFQCPAALKRVLIGPAADFNQSSVAASEWLRAAGLRNVVIYESKSPVKP